MKLLWFLCAFGPGDLAERQSRAAFVPQLSVGARSVEVAVPGLVGRSIEVFAWLRWPIERRQWSTASLAGRREQLAVEAAARLRARREIARRRAAPSLGNEIDDLLDAEEAEAVLP